MAIPKYTVWLAQDGGPYSTQYNLVLLANAVDIPVGTFSTGEYNDTAQRKGSSVYKFNTSTTPDGLVTYTYSDACTIALTGETANLEIGGDYSSNEDPANVRFSQTGYVGACRSASAVYFSQNGIFHLTAQNGARTVDVDSGFSDDDILLVMSGTLGTGNFEYEGEKEKTHYTYCSGENLYLAVVRAAESLEVSSDMVGSFIVDQAMLTGGYRESGTSAGIYGVQAHKLTFDGNYRANTTIQNSKLAVYDTTEYSLANSYLHLAGISSETDFTSRGEWVNTVAVTGNSIDVALDGANHYFDTSDIDPFENPVIQNSVATIAAVEVARESGTTLSINAIGFAGGAGAWADYPSTMTVTGNDVTLWAYGKDDTNLNQTSAAPTATITGNTASTAVLTANTITLGDVAANAAFSAIGGTTTLRAEISNGRVFVGETQEKTGGEAKIKDNVVSVTGLCADVIAVNAFAGTISVAGGSLNAVAWNQNCNEAGHSGQTDGYWSWTFGDEALVAAGIFAADRMTVSAYFGGDIVVTRGTASGMVGETVAGEIAGKAVGELLDAFTPSGTVSGGTFFGSLDNCTIVGKITDGTVESWNTWAGTFGGTITDAVPIGSGYLTIVGGTVISEEGVVITEGAVEGGTICGGTVVDGEISGTAAEGQVGLIIKETDLSVDSYACGILTPYLMDKGRIAVNISSGDDNLLDACIKAGKIESASIVGGGTVCTDAITGVLTGAVIGIDVLDAFVSPYYVTSVASAEADSIDITGFIGGDGMKYALKVGASTATSIRVSGTIAVDENNFAIAAQYGGSDEALDDVVEIAANAVVAKENLLEAVETIAEGGRVYASADDGLILIENGDAIGTITGGTVTGKILLSLSAATNWAIINTRSTLGSADEKFHFIGNEGLLNLSFQLDGKAQDKAVYLTDFDDASMTSTTTIGINCDYAKSGDVYQLIQYDENITTKWEKRKITFVWRGEELVAAFDPAANNSVTVTFSDGTTATLEMVSNGTTSTLQATVVKSASASQLVTLDTYRVTEKWNAAKNTYVIDWSACNWADTMAKFDYYEIEYSINGENTIVTRLDKDQTSLTINQVLSGDVILWRIRGVDINLYNAGYYANETLWSDYLGQACVQSEALPSIDMSASFADASGQYTKDGAKVNGAAALVYWDPAVATNTTVDHYVIEYVESLDRKTVAEAKAMLDGGTTTSVKQTTDTSVMLSSLTTRCYVYWRVKAVDVYGNESDYKMGEEFRVFDGDSTAPVFTDSKVNVSYTRGTTSDKVNITVGWSYATDSGSGVKYYKVTLTDENGISQSQTCNFSGDHAYALAFNDIAKGNYTVTVTVSDYSKNYATIQSEPATPPTLDADAFTVNYVKVDASYINFKVAWDQAVSASGIAIDDYVVTLWQNGVNKASQTVTDDGSSHYTATFDGQIFETGEYTVTIQAYDLARNASEQLSQYRICGAIDLNGDWGTITKQPTITVEYEEEWIEKAGGHTYFDTKTGQIVTGGTVCVKNVTSASAVFTWEDTFSNERGVYYALDFSNTDDFSGTVYTYYTESSDVVYEAGTRTVTLDQDATRPISLLAAISGGTLNQKVYWRLRAGGMDDDGFVSTSVSGVNSFYFDYDDGTPICHNVSPAVATVEVAQTQGGTGTSARAYDGKLAVTITTEQTDLGIAKYEVYFVNMSNSSYSYTWTADYNSDLIVSDDGYNTFTKVFDLTQIFGNVYYDGTYAMVVNTYNAAGSKTSTDQVIVNGSTVTGFVVDTVAPLKVEDVTLLTFANGVLVSWDASADAYGIAKYVIKGKVSGSSIWQDMLTVDGTTTSAMISGFSDNTYQFAVCAVDNNGNVSEYSEQPSINVYTKTDYEDNYLPDKWVTFSTTDFSVSNSIGSADKADYFCIACDVSCLLSVDLSALVNMSGNSLGITIGLYKYDGSGNEQAIQLFSVTQDQQLLTNYVLEAGEYFVKITANNASAIDVYALNFSKSNFSTAAYNNKSDNNWMTLDENTFTAISTENSLTDWVGYGDDIDYRRVDFTESGNYSFNLSTTDDPATLVLYEQVGATLTAIKSISTSAASNFTTMTALLDNQKTYYIGVTASGNALLKNSNYLASVTLNYAYNDSTVKYACHADDTAALATVNCAALSMDNAVIRDWVGFSDSIDFRRIYLEHGGNYNLRLSGVTHAMRFTLYQETNGVLTTLQSITIDPAEGRSATGKIGNVWLDASANATYYVSMEALNAADEKNSNYLLNLSAYTVYSEGAHNDDDTAALAAAQEKYHLAINGSVTNEWVGFGDTIDYRKIDLACSGAYCFTLSGIVNATQLALWQKVDGELVLVNQLIVNEGTEALWQQLDQANEYYISVACVNPDAAHNSYYAMTMTGTEFPRAQHGDDWSDLATMGSASSEYGSFGTITEANKGSALTRWDDVTGEIGQQINWVSFGDKVDYVAFTLNSAAKLVFNLTSVNTVNAKLSINALNAGSAGYSLTELGSAITCASSSETEVWLTQGTYYIAVEALNADAGGNGDYAVSLGADSVFYLKSNVGNTNSTWQDAARYQSEPYESATTLTDWIGFGNAADYWKVQMTQDGKLQIALTGEAWTAYQAGDIELELINGDERSVDLIQSGNVFTSELEFAKGNVCYFGISCTDKTGMSFQTDYTAKLSVLAIK